MLGEARISSETSRAFSETHPNKPISFRLSYVAWNFTYMRRRGI